MIRGTTALIAHIGWPTHAFKAPMIYNPYFEQRGIDAVVVPMGCRSEALSRLPARGVHAREHRAERSSRCRTRSARVALLDMQSPAVRIAGSCNAVRRERRRPLVGDMFDGEGFVRGLRRKGCAIDGARALVVGAGGVGSAIAASLAAAGAAAIGLHDARAEAAEALAERLRTHCPALRVRTGSNDPGRLRHRRQRDAAGHERRRSDADGCRRASRRRPSSARW